MTIELTGHVVRVESARVEIAGGGGRTLLAILGERPFRLDLDLSPDEAEGLRVNMPVTVRVTIDALPGIRL